MKTLFGLAAALALGFGALAAAPEVASAQVPSFGQPRGPAVGAFPGRAPAAGRFTAQTQGRFAVNPRGRIATQGRFSADARGRFVRNPNRFAGQWRGRRHARFRHFGPAIVGAYALGALAYNSCWEERWTPAGLERVWVCDYPDTYYYPDYPEPMY
jgi:hypothetical protein